MLVVPLAACCPRVAGVVARAATDVLHQLPPGCKVGGGIVLLSPLTLHPHPAADADALIHVCTVAAVLGEDVGRG